MLLDEGGKKSRPRCKRRRLSWTLHRTALRNGPSQHTQPRRLKGTGLAGLLEMLW